MRGSLRLLSYLGFIWELFDKAPICCHFRHLHPQSKAKVKERVRFQE
jgi:hypothetical protein